jgi:hypothetical protein
MIRRAVALVALTLAASAATSLAAEPAVVAVVASDSYADLKKQIRWVGTLVDQPMLDVLAETPLMAVTQFKGLAGLDPTRPLGVVVTAAGDLPVAHAYVPVKDLGKLLDALAGVTGPVEEADGVRRISPPGGMPLDVVEKNGWAIVGPPGATPPVADPTALFGAVTNQYTLGVEAFPGRMPEGMREQLRALLGQAAAAAAAQGQQVDPAGLAGLVDTLQETESLLIGAAIDMERERVFVESWSRLAAGTKAAAAAAAIAKGVATVATPATADGKPPALSLHLAAAVPDDLRQAAIDGLATVTAADGSDAGTETAVGLLREAIAAMIAAGGYDATLAVDTSEPRAADALPVPAVTAGMKVKDGAALEAKVKKLVGDAGELPGLKVAFDTGKAAGANLHTLTLDGIGIPGAEATGDPLEVTLAVAPDYAFVLAGGDVPARLAATAAASGKPDAAVKPMADVNVALGPLLRYMAAVARVQDDDSDEAAGLEAAAGVADAQPSALIQFLVRPIDRGMALRLSADAGAVRTVAASVKPQRGPAAPVGAGVPIPGGAAPIPFPIPVQ